MWPIRPVIGLVELLGAATIERAAVERDEADKLGGPRRRAFAPSMFEPMVFLDIQSRCRSLAGVAVDLGTATWPFSMRIVPSASRP